MTGATIRIIPTHARLMDTTVRAGLSGAYSSAPDPGMADGMDIRGAGAGVTPAGMDIAADMDTVAGTTIGAATAAVLVLRRMADVRDSARAMAFTARVMAMATMERPDIAAHVLRRVTAAASTDITVAADFTADRWVAASMVGR